ncbi:MAG: FAD-binding oxidoreductase [Thermoleophilaceae bacterium]
MTVLDRLDCEVITPGDARYDTARALWNGSIDRRPAAIVQPRTDQEVAQALLRARDDGAEIAVRGGGHSMPGHSMTDGGVTIDLSAMNHVAVDGGARRARVGGGALLGDVARATEPHGLAIPYGHVSHTGVGGLTLGGGIGWIMRRYGLAIDRMRAARVVTASGDIVRASAEENDDLFWALRGGGGNFGIVTEFEFELCEHGPQVLAGLLLHPLERATDALRFSRDFMDSAPDEVTVYETFMTVPPEAPFPEELHGRPAFGIGIVYSGDPEEGERVLRPLREFGPPALDGVGAMPLTAVQEMLDPTAPHGMHSYSKSHWLAELPDDAIDRMVALHEGVPSPMSLIITGRMGGAVERVAPESTAFAHRDPYRLLWVIGAWWEGDDAEQIEWTRGVFDTMTPHSTGGVYVNAIDEEPAERTRDAYRSSTWERLVEAKDRWDPDNVLRLNYNVPPSARARTA